MSYFNSLGEAPFLPGPLFLPDRFSSFRVLSLSKLFSKTYISIPSRETSPGSAIRTFVFLENLAVSLSTEHSTYLYSLSFNQKSCPLRHSMVELFLLQLSLLQTEMTWFFSSCSTSRNRCSTQDVAANDTFFIA